tara:strand:+ start:7724 stop:8719 length:996 start_codon:yes stop_codon:yes gene_type:complete
MFPFVTVIIPIYNGEKYLARCIESVLSQKYQNFEILLINDGSTDSSEEICNAYCRSDPKIRLINKANGGVSSARNLGIKFSLGTWITFLDCDDTINFNFISALVVDCGSVDVVFGGYEELFEVNKEIYFVDDVDYLSSELNFFVRDHISSCLIRAPWAKIFRKDFLIDNSLLFDETINLGEDTLFNFRCFLKVPRVSTRSEAIYYWHRENESSLTAKADCVDWYSFLKIYVPEFEMINARLGEVSTMSNDIRQKCFVLTQKVYKKNLPYNERIEILKYVCALMKKYKNGNLLAFREWRMIICFYVYDFIRLPVVLDMVFRVIRIIYGRDKN